MIRTYSEAIAQGSFINRFHYLKLSGKISDPTFGSKRYVNQILYHSLEWRHFRDLIIERDKACDLACEGHDIYGRGNILIHHINPITIQQVIDRDPMVFDPENVICVSLSTHNAIHYGSLNTLPKESVERKPGDTSPWKI